MPEIKLHRRQESISVFFSPCSLCVDDLLENPESIKRKVIIDPSFSHLASSESWQTPPVQIRLDVDAFKDIFLSEDSLEGVTIKKATRSTLYFEISGVALKKLANAVTKENTAQVSQELLLQERIAYENHDESHFQFNYKFPISFLAPAVQQALNLKRHSTHNPTNDTKKRLTPSHEIYDRIKYDQSMEQENFVIGYLDRFTGIKEIAYTSFVTLDNERFFNTSVPFHRIRYYKSHTFKSPSSMKF
mmetsp:Transcript_17645/g.22432  ORF Transcript_17645/g.22432 Transcript_17645/m.22432 type:complete len:246 (-) Transcript_17645:126-863(-)